MSIAGDRQAIADLLSTVDGVTGSTYRPVVMSPGAGWPLLESVDRDRDFQVRWRVVVILPAGERRASEWFDAHHEELAETLEEFGYVERLEPTSVETDAGDLDAALITVRKEA